MKENDLAKDGLAVEPEEEPDVERVGEVDYVEEERGPGKRAHGRVHAGVVHEPGEPVWQVGHPHNAHAFLGPGFFFSYDAEHCVVHRRNKSNQQKSGE